jgi:hypothetical protein
LNRRCNSTDQPVLRGHWVDFQGARQALRACQRKREEAFLLRCWYLRAPACAKIIAGQESANVLMHSRSLQPFDKPRHAEFIAQDARVAWQSMSSRTGGFHLTSSTPFATNHYHNGDRNHDITVLESRCAAFMILQWKKTWAVVNAALHTADSCQKEIDPCWTQPISRFSCQMSHII